MHWTCADTPEWPDHMYEWHREGFDAPTGAEVLAEGHTFPVQAFRYGTAYGVQFHPEVTYAMMCRWTTRGCARLELPGAQPRATHFADRAAYDGDVRRWLRGFLDHWLTCHEQQPEQAARPRKPAEMTGLELTASA